jgi:sigma-B regulation protein RsbU (phosphoserine phosphatase)
VGGDYYDFIQVTPDEAVFCIADVSGKGVPAALLMSNFQASLRALSRQDMRLVDMIKELNYLVMSSAHGEHFITAFIGRITASGEIRYVNAGHNRPLIIKEKEVIQLDKGCTMLGAFDELPFIHEGEASVEKNNVIIGYTDGITETRNDDEEEYGEERFEALVMKNSEKTVTELIDCIVEDLNEFKQSQSFFDDLTLLVLRYKG